MSDPEAKARIEELFNKRWPQQGLDTAYSLDFRAKIAQELFQLETDEFKAALRAKAEETLQEKLLIHKKLWEDGGSESASADPDIQAL